MLRVGKSCLIKKFIKGIFNESYNETNAVDSTNRTITLIDNTEEKELPYSNISKIKLKIFDSPGKSALFSVKEKFFNDIKTLFIMFDLSNEESFKHIQNYINLTKKFFEINKKDKKIEENDIIKSPVSFNNIPIIIIGNKLDLAKERKVLKSKIDEYMNNLKSQNDFNQLIYREISIKEDKGVETIFQETIFYYFKRNFKSITFKDNTINQPNLDNNIQIDENKEKKKRKSMDKSFVIFHQMLEKVKKQFYNEVNTIKEENKKEIIKLKSDFDEEKKELYNKLNYMESKNKDLEKLIKIKIIEIEKLKREIRNFPSNEITLKFKIPDKKFTKEIIIKTKLEKKMSEVINSIYDLCPYLSNLKIKSFCLEGDEKKKIDEMKTVLENKLTNDSLIYLVI